MVGCEYSPSVGPPEQRQPALIGQAPKCRALHRPRQGVRGRLPAGADARCPACFALAYRSFVPAPPEPNADAMPLAVPICPRLFIGHGLDTDHHRLVN
jgi:hypothetical protein